MKFLSKETVENYCWNKKVDRYARKIAFGGVGCGLLAIVMNRYINGFHREGASWTFSEIILLSLGGILMMTGGLFLLNELSFALGGKIHFLHLLKLNHRDPDYALLERWEKFSGLPVTDFPTSTFHVEARRHWAATTLKERLNAFQIAIREQEAFQRYVKNFNWGEVSAEEQTVIIESQSLDQTVRNVMVAQNKALWLDFWDLVTESYDGIGILVGPRYRDPEVFRQEMISGGTDED